MFMKYKCTIEIEMPFPEAEEKALRTAKGAIDELIDGSIYDAVYREMCTDKDKLTVTRENLEFVEDNGESETEATTCSSCDNAEAQDVVSDEA